MTGEPRSGHAPVRISLAGADLAQHDAVTEFLRRERIYHEFVGDRLVVPASRAEEVRLVLDAAASDRMPDSILHGVLPTGTGFPSSRPDPPLDRSGREGAAAGDVVEVYRQALVWTRPARWIVDGVVGAVVMYAVLVALVAAGVSVEWAAVVGWAVAAGLVVIRPNAITGRTPGAVVTRTRVAGFVELGRPGWARSITRWVVPQLPGLVAGAVFVLDLGRRVDVWVSSTALVGSATVYLSLLWNPDSRGIHDRWSGTIVIDEAPVRRSAG